jgi:hypothetical protein
MTNYYFFDENPKLDKNYNYFDTLFPYNTFRKTRI